MAEISFLAGSTTVNHLAGSGLGFFGGSFGQSVQINQFQDTTFITDGAGTTQKGSANNVKYATDTTAFAAGIVSATGLKYIPNEKATVNIRFTNDSAVRTQNCKLRIFDRVNKDHPASGVITRVALGGEVPLIQVQTLRGLITLLPIQVTDFQMELLQLVVVEFLYPLLNLPEH